MKISEQKWETGEQVGLPYNVYDDNGNLVCQCKSEAVAKAISGLPRLLKAFDDLRVKICDGGFKLEATRGDVIEAVHARLAIEPEQSDEFMYEELTADNWMQYYGKVVEFSCDGGKWYDGTLHGFSNRYKGEHFADDAFTPYAKARAKFRKLKVGERIEDGDEVEYEPGKWRPCAESINSTLVEANYLTFRRLVPDFEEQSQ